MNNNKFIYLDKIYKHSENKKSSRENFKTYRGIKHKSSSIPKEYDFTYDPNEIRRFALLSIQNLQIMTKPIHPDDPIYDIDKNEINRNTLKF